MNSCEVEPDFQGQSFLDRARLDRPLCCIGWHLYLDWNNAICEFGSSQWVDLVEAGWDRLAPSTDAESMQGAIRNALAAQGKLLAPYR